MFDVLWTDPNRELVGERMVRKEQEAKMKDQERKQNPGSNRQSTSTDSSTSSDRGFGLFTTRSRRKTPTPSRHKNSPASPALSASSSNRINRSSAFCVKSLLLHQDGSETTVKPAEGGFLPVQLPEIVDASSISSPGRRVRSSGWLSISDDFP